MSQSAGRMEQNSCIGTRRLLCISIPHHFLSSNLKEYEALKPSFNCSTSACEKVSTAEGSYKVYQMTVLQSPYIHDSCFASLDPKLQPLRQKWQ